MICRESAHGREHLTLFKITIKNGRRNHVTQFQVDRLYIVFHHMITAIIHYGASSMPKCH